MKLARALGRETELRRDGDGSPAGVLSAALHDQHHQLLRRDPGTRTGLDPEDLHQFRVATRRLRAFLRTGSALVDPEWADGLRAELKWLGGLLGAVRDQDVLIERFRREAEELEAIDEVALRQLFAALAREREAGPAGAARRARERPLPRPARTRSRPSRRSSGPTRR